jgi:hypothetical protein
VTSQPLPQAEILPKDVLIYRWLQVVLMMKLSAMALPAPLLFESCSMRILNAADICFSNARIHAASVPKSLPKPRL